MPILDGKHTSAWLQERLPLTELGRFLSDKNVPRHRYTFWYVFGGLTGFFLVVQFITGILLALYYHPAPETAYESVKTIINDVPHGWLIRSIHVWSANLMIVSILIHMFSVFLMKAYRKPRELMWITGVVLLLIVLGFAFTGYLLPWDTRAYFATLIGTEVPKSIPVLGPWGVSLLKGSEEIGAATLSRMFTIHTILLPITVIFLAGLHILLNQIYGVTVPPGVNERGSIPFAPNFVYRDLTTWTIGLAALLTLSILQPWELGEKADPYASAPPGIKPEWFFWPLYQTLRMVPAKILSVNGEFVVNILVGLAIGFWAVVPFIDRPSTAHRVGGVMTGVGVFAILYLLVTIVLAYST